MSDAAAAATATQALPGYNRTAPDPDMLAPATCTHTLPPPIERRVVLIATATIDKGAIFTNGLYQNVYIIYRLCEALGLLPFFLFNKTTDNPEPFLQDCRILTVEGLLKNPIPVHVYIEIGMSIDQSFRKFLKALGAKMVKLYLGNILNIDIETIQFYPAMNFSHHVVGEMDEIWVSPHYEMHREYAGILNQVCDPAAAKIAPYVWDPCFISEHGARLPKWQPINHETIVIMEPNISFQKSAVVPLLALEARKRIDPSWNPRIILINGERLKMTAHFSENLLPQLSIHSNCEFRGRNRIVDILTEAPGATFICHQVNNEYNYMIMELLYCGFPVVHNGERWRDFGYYYAESDAAALLAAYDKTRDHATDVAVYKSRAHTLFWRHSIHNPAVQTAWAELLGGATQPRANI
jgi:hypothetical protein